MLQKEFTVIDQRGLHAKSATKIVKLASLHADVVMMFAKLQWLEGVGRKRFFAGSPLKYVYVYTFRASPWRNGEEFDENGKRRATQKWL